MQQAYIAQRYVETGDDGREPANRPARYSGPKLVLQASYIGAESQEPTIGIDAEGVAYMPSYPAFGVGPIGTNRPGVSRSTDGGRTWQPTASPLGPVVSLDPYLTVDETTGRVFNPELNLAVGASLQYSDDQGKTWTQSPLCCGNPVNDHQTMAFGPPPEGESAIGYPNIGYYCFNRVADASCARSLDGGRTWVPAGTPAFTGVTCAGDPTHSSIHGHLVVDAVGRVYLPAGYCGKPVVFVSEDGALTWRAVTVSTTVGLVVSEGIGGNHTSVDVDSEGTIYYLWWTEIERLPVLSVSKDAGRTWSAPVNVAPPGVREVNFPTLDAGPRPGQLAIAFPGSAKHYADEQDPSMPWNYYVTTSLNADSARPLFVSATANPPSDPIHRGRCQARCAGMLDFIDVEFAPSGEIWAAATDTCTAKDGCRTARAADTIVATDAQGVAVRQLAGPGLPARRSAQR